MDSSPRTTYSSADKLYPPNTAPEPGALPELTAATTVSVKARAPETHIAKAAQVLAAFFTRQGRSVRSRAGAKNVSLRPRPTPQTNSPSPPDTPKTALKNLFDGHAETRAQQVAATETTAMSGFGTVEAARHTDRLATKTWLTRARPRPSHSAPRPSNRAHRGALLEWCALDRRHHLAAG